MALHGVTPQTGDILGPLTRHKGLSGALWPAQPNPSVSLAGLRRVASGRCMLIAEPGDPVSDTQVTTLKKRSGLDLSTFAMRCGPTEGI